MPVEPSAREVQNEMFVVKQRCVFEENNEPKGWIWMQVSQQQLLTPTDSNMYKRWDSIYGTNIHITFPCDLKPLYTRIGIFFCH